MRFVSFTVAASLLAMAAACSSTPELPQLGKSPMKDVIAAMTTEEKVSLVLGTGMNVPGIDLGPGMEGPVGAPAINTVPFV